MAEFLDTAMIGALRTNLGIGHHFFPVYKKLSFKVIGVPKLKQSHIKANMRRVQSAILRELVKHPIEVFYIIYFIQNTRSEFIVNFIFLHNIHDFLIIIVQHPTYFGIR